MGKTRVSLISQELQLWRRRKSRFPRFRYREYLVLFSGVDAGALSGTWTCATLCLSMRALLRGDFVAFTWSGVYLCLDGHWMATRKTPKTYHID